MMVEKQLSDSQTWNQVISQWSFSESSQWNQRKALPMLPPIQIDTLKVISGELVCQFYTFFQTKFRTNYAFTNEIQWFITGSNVSSYVAMICDTLRNSIPKAVVYCQVRESRRSLLNRFYARIGSKEVCYIHACYYSATYISLSNIFL